MVDRSKYGHVARLVSLSLPAADKQGQRCLYYTISFGKIVCVNEQGCAIRKAGGRIVAAKGAEVLAGIPTARVSNVLIFGMAQISTQAVHALLDAERISMGVAPWEGRTRRPPKDPVNALLSLGYVLLANELASLLGVFECYLTLEEMDSLTVRIESQIDHEDDSVRFYTLCEHCKGLVKVIGAGGVTRDPGFIVV